MLVTAVDVVDEANDNATPDGARRDDRDESADDVGRRRIFRRESLEECASRGQPEARQRLDPYHKTDSPMGRASFTCPQIAFVRIQHANGVPLSGPLAPSVRRFSCTRAKEIGRSLAIGPHDAALRRHRAWMATSAAKQAYKLRRSSRSSESSRKQGARRFLLRGLTSVAAEWTMLATDLRTLWRRRSRAFVQLPHGPNLRPAS